MKKVSGCKTVIVPISTLGNNYFPFIEDLKDKYIKYVDTVIMNTLTPNVSGTPVADTTDLFMTLASKSGNLHTTKDMPLLRYDVATNLGVRVPICQKISLQNSYILNEDANKVGQYVILVFWYDEPMYSARNITTNTMVDGFSIPIITNTGKNAMPDNRTMTGKRFRKLYVTYPTLTPTLGDGITDVQAKSLYVTFQKSGYALIENLPLPLLFQIPNLEFIEFANIIFDFTYSYVQVGGIGGTGFTGKEVFINAEYEA